MFLPCLTVLAKSPWFAAHVWCLRTVASLQNNSIHSRTNHMCSGYLQSHLFYWCIWKVMSFPVQLKDPVLLFVMLSKSDSNTIWNRQSCYTLSNVNIRRQFSCVTFSSVRYNSKIMKKSCILFPSYLIPLMLPSANLSVQLLTGIW